MIQKDHTVFGETANVFVPEHWLEKDLDRGQDPTRCVAGI